MYRQIDIDWANGILDRIHSKMQCVLTRSHGIIPYRTENGRFENMAEKNICFWTNGFWEGLLWLLYKRTGEPGYRTAAKEGEALLDRAFREYDTLHHDVGFLWHLSAGLDYKLTGNESSRVRALYAASLLMSRFNLAGGYIRAWNLFKDDPRQDAAQLAIIDTMMNLAILYWASEQVGDPRFARVARAHADKTVAHHIRPDGSVKHIVVYDPETGEELDSLGGQGYARGSSWSRGHGWAIYGMMISYLHTGNETYLNACKRVANYFIACVQGDWLPHCDFRSPAEPVVYDASAGAIAACGLLDLADAVPEYEGALYRDAAINILRAMEAHFCNWDHNVDGILYYGAVNYGEKDVHNTQSRNRFLIYSDFFFTEALMKIVGSDLKIW